VDCHVRLSALAGGVGAPSGNPAAVREESHLEDMRSAIRGDFARLAERRGDQELMQVEAGAEVADTEPTVTEPAGDPATRRSWFARFVSP
jgi:hypothetical protein